MPIEYQKDGRIAIITINRPEVMNALTPDTLWELTERLMEFRDDKELWVGIVTGSGERAFCTGMDLRTARPGGEINPVDEQGKLKPPIARGLELYKPLIAAVNGYAFGGGFEIALACDIRLAAENARFGLTEVTLGLIPGWGGTQRLPRLLPFKARELILMGKQITAADAFALNLVSRVVPQKDLMATAKEWANQVCQNGPLAVQAAKEAIVRGESMTLADGLRLEYELEGKAMRTKDFAEGRQAFMEKRKPVYKGE